MKRRRQPYLASRLASRQSVSPVREDLGARNGFVRGFIAAGLAAAAGARRPARKETLRLALRGGTALAAGIAGANAVDRRDYAAALLAVAAGAAGLSAIDTLLFPDSSNMTKEVDHEQEKIEEDAAQSPGKGNRLRPERRG
jgi:hypothetical protein